VPILVDAYPTVDQIESGVDPRLLGLFSGTPMTEASAVGGTPHLTAIHLILHETAHFFGLDEDQVEALGLG
jgi:predicted Zn-dependent protease with MMP-like domain